MPTFKYEIHGQPYEIEAASAQEADAKAAAIPAPETTAGGFARSGLIGAVKGAMALPQMAGLRPQFRAEGTGEPVDVGGSFSRVTPYIERAARWVGDQAEKRIGGEGVGDTGLERFAGVAGELGGALATTGWMGGGGAARPLMTRAMRGVTPWLGASGGAHAAREVEAIPGWAEVPMTLAGGGVGALARGAAPAAYRGGRALVNVAKDQGAREMDAVTRGVFAKADDVTARTTELKEAYNAAEGLASRHGVRLGARGLKADLEKTLDDLGPIARKDVPKDIQKTIRELGDDVSVREFRQIQRGINDKYARQAATRKGPKRGIVKMNRAVNEALDRAIEEAAVASDPVRQAALMTLRETNRNWSALQKTKGLNKLWQQGAEAARTPKGAPAPEKFDRWLRNPRTIERIADEYGMEHARNLSTVSRNLTRIPDEIADSLVGALDAERQATLDMLRTGGHLLTMPIGSLRYKGRRLAESFADVYGGLAGEKRALTLVQALEDPALASHLAEIVTAPAARGPILGAATTPLRYSLPGMTEGGQ